MLLTSLLRQVMILLHKRIARTERQVALPVAKWAPALVTWLGNAGNVARSSAEYARANKLC